MVQIDFARWQHSEVAVWAVEGREREVAVGGLAESPDAVATLSSVTHQLAALGDSQIVSSLSVLSGFVVDFQTNVFRVGSCDRQQFRRVNELRQGKSGDWLGSTSGGCLLGSLGELSELVGRLHLATTDSDHATLADRCLVIQEGIQLDVGIDGDGVVVLVFVTERPGLHVLEPKQFATA